MIGSVSIYREPVRRCYGHMLRMCTVCLVQIPTKINNTLTETTLWTKSHCYSVHWFCATYFFIHKIYQNATEIYKFFLCDIRGDLLQVRLVKDCPIRFFPQICEKSTRPAQGVFIRFKKFYPREQFLEQCQCSVRSAAESNFLASIHAIYITMGIIDRLSSSGHH